MSSRASKRGVAAAGALLLLLGLLQWAGEPAPGSSVGPGSSPTRLSARDAGRVVEVSGVVERVLSDDEKGSRHQRFILELASGQTVLVAHNIDLAPRAPVKPGVEVALRGQYETNERGGVLHWTHHAPDGSRPGGWLRVGDRTYR